MMIFVLAFSVRLVHLGYISQGPLFDVPVVDERTYLNQAKRIARDEGVQAPFWQPPLYPYFLGLLYKAFGENYYAFRSIQLALGALSCVLVYYIGKEAFGSSVGIISSLIASSYGVLIYFEGELLPTFLSVLLNLVLVLSLFWAARGMSWWRWLTSGALLGLSALAVANVLLFVPLVLAWMWSKVKRNILWALIFCAGVASAITPVTLRNYILGHDLVLISSNAGVNFYIGNNPDYDRTLGIRPGSEWWRLTSLPREEGITKPSLQSMYFFSKAWDFIKEEPLKYGKLLLRKFYLFWRGEEIKRNEDIYFFRRYSPPLRALLWKNWIAFPFGIIGPLGILGMGLCVGRLREPKVLLLFIFVVTYMASIVLFFVCSRYRVPVLPFIILFAGYALRWGYGMIRRRYLLKVAYASVPLFALLFVANAGVGRMGEDGDAQVHYDLAYAYMQKGLYANALIHAERAVAMDPNYFEARYTLGTLYALKGLQDEAVSQYERALDIYPGHVYAKLDLGVLYIQRKDYDKAIDILKDAVKMAPNLAEGHYRLGYAYAEAGSLKAAILEYRKAVEMKPSRADYRKELAFVYAQDGRYGEAIREYRQVLHISPDDFEAKNNLGILYAESGMVDQAVDMFEEVLKDHPNCLDARYNLALLYEGQGRYKAALSEYEKIVEEDPNYEKGKIYRRMALLCARMRDLKGAEENLRKYRLNRTVRELRRAFGSFAKTLIRR